MMSKIRLELFALIRDGPRAACKELINLAVADFTAAFVETSTAPGAGSAQAGGSPPPRSSTTIDIDVVPFWFEPPSAGSGDSNAIENAVADHIGGVSHSHPSASRTVNAQSLAENDENKPLTVGRGSSSSSVSSDASLTSLMPPDRCFLSRSSSVTPAPGC